MIFCSPFFFYFHAALLKLKATSRHWIKMFSASVADTWIIKLKIGYFELWFTYIEMDYQINGEFLCCLPQRIHLPKDVPFYSLIRLPLYYVFERFFSAADSCNYMITICNGELNMHLVNSLFHLYAILYCSR